MPDSSSSSGSVADLSSGFDRVGHGATFSTRLEFSLQRTKPQKQFKQTNLATITINILETASWNGCTSLYICMYIHMCVCNVQCVRCRLTAYGLRLRTLGRIRDGVC